MASKLLDCLVVSLLCGDKLIDGAFDFYTHVLAQQAFLQHLAVHQVLAHRLADGAGQTGFFLGNNAWGERHVNAHDVFGLVGPEQHAYSDIVSDIADDSAHSGPNEIM